jgi:hypothetical protein
MKNRTITTMLVAVSALLALAEAASAYYSPRLGRFLNRDPISEPGAAQVRQAARPAPSFIPRDPLNAGGLHLYGFAGNDPANKVDVLGLYYGGGGDWKEKWNCLCNCGKSKCEKGSQDAQEALAAAQKRFKPEELHNGQGDAWRHCFWSCKMVCDIGQKCAKLIADQHEEAGTRAGQPKEEADMDYHNNHVGRLVAQEYSCDCSNGCDKALADGRLKTLK